MVPPLELQAPAEMRARTVNAVKIENLAGEFVWTTKNFHSVFTLQDNSGPWWSITLEPKDDATATLLINGKTFEVPIGPHNQFSFQLFLDASLAELICNAKHAVTTRIYRKPNGPLRISLGDSDLAQVLYLQAWQMRPISPDRLTT
jgi:hypothetical protein